MNKPRYVLHPGFINRPDGDRHYISGLELARLYGVSILHCTIAHSRAYKEQTGDIHLRPKNNGDYVIPGSKAGAA
jgi:hypothetical protein